MSETRKIVHSTCYMCTEDCPITVVTDGDEVLSIDHPDCPRAEGMLDQRNSPLRWISPRLRARSDETWREVTRTQAVQATAKKLLEIREEYGPESVAFVAGFTKEARPYLQRLAHGFGSPHYLTESSCCFGSGFVAARVTLGAEYEYFLGPSRTRYPQTECRLVWSSNPTESQIPCQSHHLLADAGEVPTIVVDPRRTPLGEAAEIHLHLRPGTDGALALGLAEVIMEEGLEDKEFLARFGHGVDAYRKYVKSFPPEEVARITGVPSRKIVAAARLFGRARPGQITISPCSTVHHSNGFQNHRAILLLAALCGNLDVIGGNRPWGHRIRETSVDLAHSHVASLGPPLGAREHPLFVEHYGEGQGMRLSEGIESGKIRAVFSIGMNLMMWPNSGRLEKALASLEFVSLSDFFETPTSKLATVFFPAATHLEREALIVSLQGRILVRPAAVPPRGEAVGDTELIFEVARALGMDDPFWDRGVRPSFDSRLSGLGISLKDLPVDGQALHVERPDPPEQEYLRKGFGTPTGKVEFVSTSLEEAGHDGLPRYHEPYWSPASTPELAREYPLVLTSGSRKAAYTHSQGRLLPTLRRREPKPRVEVNPRDASARGIGDGEDVRLTSPLGQVTMTALVTDTVPPGVISAPHGWAEADINRLIPDAGLDPISGFPPFRSSLCQVEAALV
jgi:anaerobic selenocysteine-containing dehydrogenase